MILKMLTTLERRMDKHTKISTKVRNKKENTNKA